MKKYLVMFVMAMSIGLAPTVKADMGITTAIGGSIVMFGAGALFAKLASADEPHWSFRDGCTVASVHVPAAGGGYNYASYDHCKSLPRVYSGKAWTPTESRSKTS